jgi:hypothetical protein
MGGSKMLATGESKKEVIRYNDDVVLISDDISFLLNL